MRRQSRPPSGLSAVNGAGAWPGRELICDGEKLACAGERHVGVGCLLESRRWRDLVNDQWGVARDGRRDGAAGRVGAELGADRLPVAEDLKGDVAELCEHGLAVGVDELLLDDDLSERARVGWRGVKDGCADVARIVWRYEEEPGLLDCDHAGVESPPCPTRVLEVGIRHPAREDHGEVVEGALGADELQPGVDAAVRVERQKRYAATEDRGLVVEGASGSCLADVCGDRAGVVRERTSSATGVPADRSRREPRSCVADERFLVGLCHGGHRVEVLVDFHVGEVAAPAAQAGSSGLRSVSTKTTEGRCADGTFRNPSRNPKGSRPSSRWNPSSTQTAVIAFPGICDSPRSNVATAASEVLMM